MDRSIVDFSQVTPEWLTGRLRANGHVSAPEEVTKVQVESSSQHSTNSVAHLRVEYSPGVDLPGRLFLKTGNADKSVDSEVDFHGRILTHMDVSGTVPCFDAVWDDDAERGHLIFEDLSHTHYLGREGVYPGLQVEAGLIVDAIAPFHAFWWDHPLLGNGVGGFPKQDSVLWYQGVASYEKGLAGFIDRVGDRLCKQDRIIMERALASFPFKDLRGKSRLTPGNRLTLVHADVGNSNSLLPKDPTTHRAYVIDWAFWEVRMGTDDIALGLLA